MRCDKRNFLLYGVTDRSWLRGESLCSQVEQALRGGATMIQLREKALEGDGLRREAEEIRDLCRSYQVPFVINDNVDLAKEIGADGVHLGQEDMEPEKARRILGEGAIIGVSAHTVQEALRAQEGGADYLGAGAVFSTGSKSDVTPMSNETLSRICAAVDIPVVAIGGIGRDNMDRLAGSGISGVAVISAMFARPEIEAETRALRSQAERLFGTSEQKRSKRMHTALTIAGSDSGGGAGIQADIKTMTVNGVYAMSAVTALTAQNTTGVAAILEATPEFLRKQLDCVFTDIRPEAVKIGMVSSAALIEVIAEALSRYQAEHIVVDPVMVATSGAKLISEDAVAALKECLLPLAEVLTPNIPEAQVLAQMEIRTEEDMVRAAEKIGTAYGCAVLVKGGHQLNDANDLLYRKGSSVWFHGKRIDNPNTHGTGCTLSSAIAANLAKGFSLEESVERAKTYISGALGAMLDLGKGSGPMNHAFAVTGEFTREAEEED